jgi:hypothetical protein
MRWLVRSGAPSDRVFARPETDSDLGYAQLRSTFPGRGGAGLGPLVALAYRLGMPSDRVFDRPDTDSVLVVNPRSPGTLGPAPAAGCHTGLPQAMRRQSGDRVFEWPETDSDLVVNPRPPGVPGGPRWQRIATPARRKQYGGGQ